jgi:hypothetical protein
MPARAVASCRVIRANDGDVARRKRHVRLRSPAAWLHDLRRQGLHANFRRRHGRIHIINLHSQIIQAPKAPGSASDAIVNLVGGAVRDLLLFMVEADNGDAARALFRVGLLASRARVTERKAGCRRRIPPHSGSLDHGRAARE